jgi:hypothetical protein
MNDFCNLDICISKIVNNRKCGILLVMNNCYEVVFVYVSYTACCYSSSNYL